MDDKACKRCGFDVSTPISPAPTSRPSARAAASGDGIGKGAIIGIVCVLLSVGLIVVKVSVGAKGNGGSGSDALGAVEGDVATTEPEKEEPNVSDVCLSPGKPYEDAPVFTAGQPHRVGIYETDGTHTRFSNESVELKEPWSLRGEADIFVKTPDLLVCLEKTNVQEVRRCDGYDNGGTVVINTATWTARILVTKTGQVLAQAPLPTDTAETGCPMQAFFARGSKITGQTQPPQLPALRAFIAPHATA